jgi:hypothetical protein
MHVFSRETLCPRRPKVWFSSSEKHSPAWFFIEGPALICVKLWRAYGVRSDSGGLAMLAAPCFVAGQQI